MSSDNPLLPLVRKLQLWSTLDEADRAAILALPCVVREAKAGQHIVHEGDRTSHSCLLVSGFAYRQKIVRNGRRSILSIHMKGDVVDLQNSLLRVADHSVLALTPVRIAAIPREAVTRLAFARPNVGMAMWYDTLVDASIFREWIVNIGRRDAHSRMAHVLCEFALRMTVAGLGQQHRFELPMTQDELGDVTALTPIHVNRTLMQLEHDGLIRRSRRAVFIDDWARLEAAADFDSTYLHLSNEAVLEPAS